MIRRTSGLSRFNIYKFSEVLGLRSMEKVVTKTNFVMNALFYFESMQKSEYRGDIFSFFLIPFIARAREVCSNRRRYICCLL